MENWITAISWTNVDDSLQIFAIVSYVLHQPIKQALVCDEVREAEARIVNAKVTYVVAECSQKKNNLRNWKCICNFFSSPSYKSGRPADITFKVKRVSQNL